MAGDFNNTWMTQVRIGVFELCVLRAIDGGASYGYDIVRRLSEIKGLFTNESTIYPILAKFKRLGLVKTRAQKSKLGPPRKCHELTERGRRELARLDHFWLLVRSGVDAVGSAMRR